MELLELLEPSDLEAFMASPPPPSTLALLRCASPPAAVEACEAWSVAHIPPEDRAFDMASVAPSSSKWTLGEIDELIVAPLRLTPQSRHVIVISDGDAITSAGWDHLLKVVEDPPSPSLLWVILSEHTALPATVRGRVASSVTLRLSPPETWGRTLNSVGVESVTLGVLMAHASILRAVKIESLVEFTAALEADMEPPALWAVSVSDALTAATRTVASHARRAVTHALWLSAADAMALRCAEMLHAGTSTAVVAEAFGAINQLRTALARNCGPRPHLVATARTVVACGTAPVLRSR